MLEQTFKELASTYSDNTLLINEMWKEIKKSYTKKNRYYHTLAHLENLLAHLNKVKRDIKNWHAALFSLFYHDIIYNALKQNNEEKSAQLAVSRLEQLGVDSDTVALCKTQILATKSHELSTNTDTNYFTDADLSILGQSWETYSLYYQNVRKEYAIYPDFMYIPGRKKVLNHFINMPRIFKTTYFYEQYESQAFINAKMELGLLK